MAFKILLLEDDPNLGFMIHEHLQLNGYEVTLCTNGREGLKAFEQGRFDLCLADVMMPRLDGFAFAREVRKRNADLPLIFLTAKSLKEDRIEGFKIGCDDYVTKPFSIEELLLRIQAVLRRTKGSADDNQETCFEIGEYSFDSDRQILRRGITTLSLTSRESELLRLLCLHCNQILEQSTALCTIWGEDSYFNSRSMDVFISRLRKYLKDDSRIEIINIHGRGYKLMINPE